MPSNFSPVLQVVILFFLGLISPGPNFFVVIESTLSSGRRAGLMTGLGAALGDAIYASCGLSGMAVVVLSGGRIFYCVKLLGGVYLIYIGLKMMLSRTKSTFPSGMQTTQRTSLGRKFLRGLATDLANPKTVIFFTSIFALVIRPDTRPIDRVMMLLGIVLTSITWRAALAWFFGSVKVRTTFERHRARIERSVGCVLTIFGLQLMRRAADPLY